MNNVSTNTINYNNIINNKKPESAPNINKSEYFKNNKINDFENLISVIGLNNNNILKNAQFLEYDKHFLNAIKNRTYKNFSINEPVNNILYSLVEKFFQDILDDNGNKISPKKYSPQEIRDKLQLKEEHIKEILNIYKVENEIPQKKASTLLTLSGIFVRLASRDFFDQDGYNKATALKHYAYALMKEASRLYPDIIPKKFNSDDSNNWINQLLGIEKLDSVRFANLSIVILGESIKNGCSYMIPDAWLMNSNK